MIMFQSDIFRKLTTIRRQTQLRFAMMASLAAIVMLAGCVSQSGLERSKANKIDGFLTQIIEKFEIPGLAIAITRGGEIVYSNAYGVRNLETETPIATNSIFHWASVSKPFVATAVMQLVEQGKMSLDDPVTKWLPYFKLADPRYKDITIRQILNHTSGMPDVPDYEWYKPQYDEGAAERYVRSLTGEKMLFAPGERWQYSNMAFDTMGDVIAKVSGQPFEVFVKENILEPLGMTESSFLIKEINNNLRTTGHVWRLTALVNPIYPYNRRHAPSSTLNSNVNDLAKWAMANLNRGELNGKRILSAESYEQLFSPSATISDDTESGLSWFLSSHGDQRTISYGGGDTGYRSYMTLLPEMDMSVLIASNFDVTPMEEIESGILDILLDHEPTLPPLPIAMEFSKVYAEEGLEVAEAHYRQLEQDEKDAYRWGDAELNHLGYIYLGAKQYKSAIEIFTLNAKLFPVFANVYDSLAEAYMVTGNRYYALVNYRKVLELDETNEVALRMVKELGGE